MPRLPLTMILVAAALAGCSMPQAMRAPASATTVPAEKLTPIDATEAERIRAARTAQAQTHLSLDPQATGGPPPSAHGPEGQMLVDAPALAAAGVDIRPTVRVWERQPAYARLLFGVPQGRGDAIVQRPIQVAPQ